MSTGRAAEDASSLLVGGAQTSHHGGFGMAGNQSELPEAAAPPYYLQGQGGGRSSGQQNVPKRPRLWWSRELHEKFVNAINLLRGASKATPKTIREIMRVEVITLLQIKSHLQKYRLEIARTLSRKNIVPADGPRNTEDGLLENEQMDKEGHQGHMNRYEILDGNANHLVESQTAGVKNSEITRNGQTLTSVKLEKNNVEWYELYDGDNIKPVAPHLNSSMDDFSSDLGFTRTCNLSRSCVMFESFFDEVERFPKFEDDLMMDDGVVAMDAPAQVTNNVYPYRGI